MKKRHSELTEFYNLPEALKHCTVYALRNSAGGYLTVVHCPNSVTTTESSKNKSVTITDI